MRGSGKTVAISIILLTIILAFTSFWYTQSLAEDREARVAALLMTPEFQHCIYDESTCPQIEGNTQVPNVLGIGILLLAVVLAGYIFRSEQTQQKILSELRAADKKEEDNEKKALILSVLRSDEKKVFEAILEQQGITQHTLRLRTDFSKAKLSAIIKELEARKLVVKEGYKKTNKLFIKIQL